MNYKFLYTAVCVQIDRYVNFYLGALILTINEIVVLHYVK